MAKADMSRHTVIATIEVDFFNSERGALRCLAEALHKIADSDLVVFLGDWEKARGCKIEMEVCRTYGIPHMTSEEYMGKIWQ